MRAVYEIAGAPPQEVLTIETIARNQGIPRRYLEGILNQLRKTGILKALRGRRGGYRLAKDARKITLGEVARLMDGPIRAVVCVENSGDADCPMREDCVFLPTWQKLQQVVDQALDSTTFQQLVMSARKTECLDYTI